MIYDKNGYLDWDHILNKELPFNFIIGGRGTGKTYGILKYVLEHNKKFMLLRRSQVQVDMITSEAYNPFKVINSDLGYEDPYYGFLREGNNVSTLYPLFAENGQIAGQPRGYATALSTIKNLRGFDGSDIDFLIFDEFIPEQHEREIKFEGQAFFNAYETINRNRELQGRRPLTAILLANANNISSGILVEFEIVSAICKLQKNEQEEHIDKARGLGLWMLQNSPISKKKYHTALYRVAGSAYSRMSLENKFGSDISYNVVSKNLKEYIPKYKIGELVIYRHKSKDLYYVTTHLSGSPVEYPYTRDGVKQFKKDAILLNIASYYQRIEYENELCRVLLSRMGVV